VFACIWAILLIAQLVLVFVFGFISETRINALLYAGYGVWMVSAILGWLPMLILKKKGSVAKGKSYVHTTALVTTGLYSIIRHPQYTAGIYLNLALVLVSQHWLIILMGIIAMVLLYIDIVHADHEEINKFGEEYRQYMKEVPRTNFILGIIRRLGRSDQN
jgi:protein-S-isoprenylcysteine O-methyltransferase Ste14